jgi:LmbE family N-acetylglucosaminyl deacetylase
MTKKTIMAVGAHADDIENNTAGTLLKYKDQGYKIVYVMATNNMAGCDTRRRLEDGSEYPMPPDECYKIRREEAIEAAKYFDADPVFLEHPQAWYHKDGNFKAGMLKYGDSGPEGLVDEPSIVTACVFKESVSKLKKIILEEDPEFIFTHSMDYNQEHNGAALLVVNAFNEAHKEGGARGILLSWVSQQRYAFKQAPDVIVDISDYMDKKIEIQLLHASQAQKIWPERFRATARFWGEWSYNCEGSYGEAFKTIKIGTLF